MLHRRLLLLVVCLPLAHAGSAPVTWSLAGQWRVHDANDSAFAGAQASDGDWRTLRVPANWYSAGYDHQGALWYRHQFTLHGLTPDAMATLVFDGVDYFAEVALNGKTLTRHEGYFQRFPVDITGAVRRHNQLAVRVDSPYEDPQKDLATAQDADERDPQSARYPSGRRTVGSGAGCQLRGSGRR